MDYDERRKLYELMAQFWPNAKVLKNINMRTAWGKVLERFPYESVKNRVFELGATAKYPPDLADLTAGLGPATLSAKQQSAGATVPMPRGAHRMPTPEELEWTRKLREDVEKMGGVCPVLHKAVFDDGETGTEGEIARRRIPEECPADCRVLAYWGDCQRKDRWAKEKGVKVSDHQQETDGLPRPGPAGSQGQAPGDYSRNIYPKAHPGIRGQSGPGVEGPV